MNYLDRRKAELSYDVLDVEDGAVVVHKQLEIPMGLILNALQCVLNPGRTVVAGKDAGDFQMFIPEIT